MMEDLMKGFIVVKQIQNGNSYQLPSLIDANIYAEHVFILVGDQIME